MALLTLWGPCYAMGHRPCLLIAIIAFSLVRFYAPDSGSASRLPQVGDCARVEGPNIHVVPCSDSTATLTAVGSVPAGGDPEVSCPASAEYTIKLPDNSRLCWAPRP